MYTIKRASEMVGVPVATLRAWQRRYRVVDPRRSDSGYRLYSAADIAKLRSMRALVASGWSPKEAAEVVSGESHLETVPEELRRDKRPQGWSTPRASGRAVDLVTAAAALDPAAVSRLLNERFATGSFEHVVDGSNPSADGERHEHVVRDASDGVEVDLALLRARGDVVEDDLVDLVVVEALGELLGGRDIDVVLELLSLGDPARDHVEARDETFRQHEPSHAANPRSSASPNEPLFSAWNWVATMLPRATTEQKSAP